MAEQAECRIEISEHAITLANLSQFTHPRHDILKLPNMPPVFPYTMYPTVDEPFLNLESSGHIYPTITPSDVYFKNEMSLCISCGCVYAPGMSAPSPHNPSNLLITPLSEYSDNLMARSENEPSYQKQASKEALDHVSDPLENITGRADLESPLNLSNLTSKGVLVTSGASGLGAALVRVFEQSGYELDF
ncbi:hypothetical protein PT974_12156 [Cladobotryum mycophilum]|uniref:Uncharacterized protein n=1 Tax=Cladobotryum mycophilum TaxID=491253 RepID=A0ABR0S8C5_9HYPO